MPDLRLERRLARDLAVPRRAVLVVGVDEAGRGPWAGPVTAAAVWLDPDRMPRLLRDGLDDSKAIPPERRVVLFDTLTASATAGRAAIGLGAASVAEIDARNILQASLAAMARAVAALEAALGRRADAALIDGDRVPTLACPAEAVVKGDGRSLSIAAASVVAKVTRDRQMAGLAACHPGYGWERNMGYGTPEHRAALARLGATPEHRRSFRPVRESLSLTY
jgi:ribonuclease HII